MLQEAYLTHFQTFNFASPDSYVRPLALFEMFDANNPTRFNTYESLISDYVDYEMDKFHLSVIEYLHLPSEVIRTLKNVSVKKRKENSTEQETLDTLEKSIKKLQPKK